MPNTNGLKRWLVLGLGAATLTSGGVAFAATTGSPNGADLAAGASSVTNPNPSVPEGADPAGVDGARDSANEQTESASEQADAARLKALAKVDEAQAKAAALASVPGTADVAELGDENGNVVWEVEVTATDGSKHDVQVDAVNAKVLASGLDD